MIFSYIILAVLGILAIVDVKYKKIPSILLTGLLFATTLLNLLLLESHTSVFIIYSLISFLFAYMLYEGDFITGVADIKIIVLIGMLVSSLEGLMTLIVMTLFIGMIGKVTYKLRNKEANEFPFIPVLFLVYLGLMLGGMIL